MAAMSLRRRSQPSLVVDPCLGDPAARYLYDALEHRDWPAAREVLAAAVHPDDRAFYLEVCGAVPGVQTWIGQHASVDELAQLVRGAHAVAWAWDARGGRSSEHTEAARFEIFFERLRLAESYLYDVVSRNPDEVAPWAFLISTARGLQLPLEDGEYRYRQVSKRFPGHWKANFEWMQTLYKRWFGSDESMHQFARDTATRSPDGSMLHALVALAHLEVGRALETSESDAYMRSPGVRADLRTAAGRSIWHPAAAIRPGWPLPFNIFALAFSVSADPAAASAVFQQLGDNPTSLPWGYLTGEPTQTFLKTRARIMSSR
jgi:hypothetical protein